MQVDHATSHLKKKRLADEQRMSAKANNARDGQSVLVFMEMNIACGPIFLHLQELLKHLDQSQALRADAEPS